MNNVKSIIQFSYNGIIQESRTSLLLHSILSQIEIARDAKFKGILISLKYASYENNRKSIISLVKQISLLHKKVAIPIAFIDYNVALYNILKILTQHTKIQLFKNSSAARVLLDPKAYKKGMQILIYDNDKENSKLITKELISYGYIVRVATNRKEYVELTKEEHYDVIVTQSTLNIENNKIKKGLKLSKKLIENLPLFMDTAVETLVSFTGLEAEKSSHTIKRFNIESNSKIICAVMHFNGDIHGSFVLVFPKDIAIIAMESLFGEEMDEDDMDAIMDGVGEFCNTITGSTKTALASRHVKVTFELPKKYDSLAKTMDDIGDENGIWIDMLLAGKPFYMFITK